MAAKAAEKELIELETRYWQALKDKDVAAATRLTDFPCIVTGPQGVSRVDKKTFTSMMQEGGWALEDFELNDVQVRLRDDVAVVAYKVHEELMVEGERVSLEAADASTWVRGDRGWRCALHTESLIGDPFGRDRQ